MPEQLGLIFGPFRFNWNQRTTLSQTNYKVGNLGQMAIIGIYLDWIYMGMFVFEIIAKGSNIRPSCLSMLKGQCMEIDSINNPR